jgi:hypothetical protein
MKDLVDCVLKHYEPARLWKPDVLWNWIAWHAVQGFALVLRDDDASILGLTLARPVMKPEDGLDSYAVDNEGPCIFLSLVISLHPMAPKGLTYAVVKRFGVRQTVAWQRNGCGEIRSIPMAKMRNLVFAKELVRHG